MNQKEYDQTEFIRLEKGKEFFMAKPVEGLPLPQAHKKLDSQMNAQGKWVNAKNSFGLTTFIQYDKRVWIKL
jgi:hypothetical protein